MIEDVLLRIAVALETLAREPVTGLPAAGTAEKPKAAPKAADKPKAAIGPSLEEVQDKIRELVAADEGNAPKIKAATASLGGKRAGDFEGDAVKLGKLLALLEAIGADSAPAAEDDDLL